VGTVISEAIAPTRAPPSMAHVTRSPDETGRMRPPEPAPLLNLTRQDQRIPALLADLCRRGLSAKIDATPEAERAEIRDIYAAKGFAGDLLDRVVDTITANRDAWLATMMDEELHLQPVEAPDIFRSAIVITIATLTGHLIPLLPFLWLSRTSALITRSRSARWYCSAPAPNRR
jgi:VIT family protein